MFDKQSLDEVMAEYKRYFPGHWKDEMYKWIAVKRFQDCWDVNVHDFAEMFMNATSKTGNLLASMNNFPRNMIRDMAGKDEEWVRNMFINLFDERLDLGERIEKFEDESEKIRRKYGDGIWKSHYQSENAITTYLWLKYPDKYYIYKYSEYRNVAKVLKNDFVPKKGGSIANVRGGFKLYDEICEYIAKDEELNKMLRDALTDECYPDRSMRTMAIDIGYFVNKFYKKDTKNKSNEWFPGDYSPEISADKWEELLKDRSVFDENSLKVMKRLKDFGGAATCKQLSLKYGGAWGFYNRTSINLAMRVHKKTDCPMLQKNYENSKWWPVLYVGQYAERGTDGIYIWKLRDELDEALDRIDLSDIQLYEESEDSPVADENEKSAERYSKDDFLKEVYMSEEGYDTLTSLLKHKKNIILQGAPGVGKSYTARRLAYSMMGEKDDDRVELIQFHQSYSYEDFIMGYKPHEEGFKLTKGIFYNFCMKAYENQNEDYFFIIDEINRGNMSKIFGELLMLIERDYRGTKVNLAYNGEAFSVPENLYIIGMMNTADRSLAMIDYALRRRFSFFEMKPAFNTEGFKSYQKSLNNDTFDELIERIIELNSEINNDDSLGSGFCIGHSYFCGQKTCTEEWMKEVIYYDIIPMLQEYWFDDRAKAERWENALRGVFHD